MNLNTNNVQCAVIVGNLCIYMCMDYVQCLGCNYLIRVTRMFNIRALVILLCMCSLAACTTSIKDELPAKVERRDGYIFDKGEVAPSHARASNTRYDVDGSDEFIAEDSSYAQNGNTTRNGTTSEDSSRTTTAYYTTSTSGDDDFYKNGVRELKVPEESQSTFSQNTHNILHENDSYDTVKGEERSTIRDDTKNDNTPMVECDSLSDIKEDGTCITERTESNKKTPTRKGSIAQTSQSTDVKEVKEMDSIAEISDNGVSPSVMAASKGQGYGFLTSTPLDSANFIWPVKGKVIKRFSKSAADYNDGINIAAPLNTPVIAASNGTVLFAGSAEKYGHTIIIKHDNGFMTAYTHNSRLIANKGDIVKRGDVIAKVGKSGDVDVPQLHFSIKKGKSTINPEMPL